MGTKHICRKLLWVSLAAVFTAAFTTSSPYAQAVQIPGGDIYIDSRKSEGLPFQFFGIPESVFAKKPAIVYVTIDTIEPFMKMAIDKEIFALRQNCASHTAIDSVAIVGSEVGSALAAQGQILVQGCRQGQWFTEPVPSDLIQKTKEQLANYQGPLTKAEVSANPLALMPVLDHFLNYAVHSVFSPKEYAFFFQIKSHGQGANGIEFFDLTTQQSKVEEQLALLGKLQTGPISQVFAEAQLGAGSLLNYWNRVKESGGHLSYYQPKKVNSMIPKTPQSGLGRNYEMGAPGASEKIRAQGVPQSEMAALFRRFKDSGVDTLFLFQESCNSTMYHSLSPSAVLPMKDSVFNYYRASGLMGYHNINWSELGANTNKSKDLLWLLQERIKQIDNTFPDDSLITELVEQIAKKSLASVVPFVESIDPILLRNFILHKDLLRIVFYYILWHKDSVDEKAAFVIKLFQKAYDAVDFRLMPMEEKRQLLGHVLNPFYFLNEPFDYPFKLPNSKMSKELDGRWRGYYEQHSPSARAYRLVLDYLLKKLEKKSIDEVKLVYSQNADLTLPEFWIADLDSYFMVSYEEMLTLFQTPNNSTLDIGFFQWIVENQKSLVRYTINANGRPLLANGPSQSNKSGTIIVQGGERWTLGSRRSVSLPSKPLTTIELEPVNVGEPFVQGFKLGRSTKISKFLEPNKLDLGFGHQKNGQILQKVFPFTFESPAGVVIQPQEKIVILVALLNDSRTAFVTGFGLYRLNTDGSIDKTFGDQGLITVTRELSSFLDVLNFEMYFPVRLTLLTDGRLLVTNMNLSKKMKQKYYLFSADGKPDLSFGDQGVLALSIPNSDHGHMGPAMAVPLRDGGFILGAWEMPDYEETGSGILNVIFGGNPSVVVKTSTKEKDSSFKLHLFKRKPDGSLDPNFGTAGQGCVETPQRLYAGKFQFKAHLESGHRKLQIERGGDSKYIDHDTDVVLVEQADGKLLLIGDSVKDGEPAVMMTRLNRDGSLDHSFGE